MADKYNYYTRENLEDKRLSDLANNPDFLSDALKFLRSDRKGYKDEDIKSMSADDVVDSVLEHFRYQTVNEVTMAKDYYFLNDNATPQDQREAYGRLMFAFDNSKGEGLFDRGAEKIKDYAGAVASAPSTLASVAAGAFTGGAGSAVVQSSKAASAAALRKVGQSVLKKSLLSGALDGSLAAGTEFTNQKMREQVAPDIGEKYSVSSAQVALSGALGGALGAAGYAIPAFRQNKAAEGLMDVIQEGNEAAVKRTAEAAELAKTVAQEAKKTDEGKKLLKYTTDTLLRSIDPRLVEEGKIVKQDVFSADLPEGILGGLDNGLVQRMSAAAYEMGQAAGIKPDEGQRITEFLANNIEKGDAIFSAVSEKYGLTPRQLSAVYAAEVSEAARLLGSQAKYAVKRGTKTLTKAETKEHLSKLSKSVDDLFERGMSTVRGEDIQAIEASKKGAMNPVLRTMKNVEDARRMFMTSQPATTMRNNIFSVAMTGIDMLDQLNTAVVRTVRRNPEATAGSTLAGTLDNFKYLVSDAYVAEALTTMLKQEAPDQMHKVFYDAAIAESHLVKDSRLAKAGAAANTLNSMSDYVFKRAVIAGNLDRQLKELGNEELGTSVMDMLSKGTVSQLPDDMLSKALDESLAFTFQRRFGGKDASATSKVAQKAINTIHNYGLTTLIPFPRYLASQAKFVSDYTGLTAVRRLAGGKSIADQELAKFMTGGALALGTYYGVAKDKVNKGYEWYEAEGPDGQTYDAQSALGPMSLHVYLADLVARAGEGLEVKDTKAILEDLNNILIGTEFRPGGGITGDVARAIDAGNIEPLMNTITDYFGSYTYPAAVVKDFYGQMDPRSSYLPEIRDATVNTADLYGVDMPMAVFQRATRHLPDFNTQAMADGLKQYGIDIKPEFWSKYLEMASTSTYTTYQEKYSEAKGIETEGYDAVRYDVFGDGPLKMRDPLMKQITGMLGRPPKNALQREMTRLQLDPFKVYNPYGEKNSALEIYTQQKLQGNLARNMDAFMKSDAYTSQTSDEAKKSLLERKIKTDISAARKQAQEELQFFSATPAMQSDFEAFVRGEYKALAGANKQDAELSWSQMRGYYGYEGMSLDEAIDAIRTEEGLTEREREVKETQLLLTFIRDGKTYKKFETDLTK